MSTTADRVAAGAAALDQLLPGWPQRINLGSLDMRRGGDDVHGQLLGHPDATDHELDDVDPDDVDLGMNIAYPADLSAKDALEAMRAAYAELTELWAGEVKARLIGIGDTVTVTRVAPWHGCQLHGLTGTVVAVSHDLGKLSLCGVKLPGVAGVVDLHPSELAPAGEPEAAP